MDGREGGLDGFMLLLLQDREKQCYRCRKPRRHRSDVRSCLHWAAAAAAAVFLSQLPVQSPSRGLGSPGHSIYPRDSPLDGPSVSLIHPLSRPPRHKQMPSCRGHSHDPPSIFPIGFQHFQATVGECCIQLSSSDYE